MSEAKREEGFFSLHMPDVLENPRVNEHKGSDGTVQAIVYLAEGVNMHVKTGDLARKLAAVFTEAAEILKPQDDEMAEFRAWRAEREQAADS